MSWKKVTIKKNGNTLTPTEIQVLELIGKKLDNHQISSQLNISINTVKTHRANLHLKFGVNRVEELIIDAINDGIIQSN